MTKEVVVTISGLQLSDGDQDTIETVHVGEYREKDGVHYVFFDEILEGHDQPVRNDQAWRTECSSQKKRSGIIGTFF